MMGKFKLSSKGKSITLMSQTSGDTGTYYLLADTLGLIVRANSVRLVHRSANSKVFLNGTPFYGLHTLQHGDEIIFNGQCLRFFRDEFQINFKYLFLFLLCVFFARELYLGYTYFLHVKAAAVFFKTKVDSKLPKQVDNFLKNYEAGKSAYESMFAKHFVCESYLKNQYLRVEDSTLKFSLVQIYPVLHPQSKKLNFIKRNFDKILHIPIPVRYRIDAFLRKQFVLREELSKIEVNPKSLKAKAKALADDPYSKMVSDFVKTDLLMARQRY